MIVRLRLIIAFLLSGIIPAGAGTSSCDSYTIPSRDGTRMFVMRALWKGNPIEENEDWLRPYKLPDGRIVDPASSFPSSGVYEVTTLHPLWTWDWWAHEDDVAVSEDVASFAVLDRHAAAYDGKFALQFFHKGKPGRRYGVAELAKALRWEPFLENSTWDGMHPKWHDEFKAKGDTLHLSTASRRWLRGYREIYRFDLNTGALRFFFIFPPWVLLAVPAAWWVLRRIKRGRRKMAPA